MGRASAFCTPEIVIEHELELFPMKFSERLRKAVPWQLRYAAKLALAALPGGSIPWVQLGLFGLGGMRLPSYPWHVLRQHTSVCPPLSPGFVYLELGPGESVGTAITARALGASRGFLVDNSPYVDTDIEVYRRIIESTAAQDLPGDVRPLLLAKNVHELLSMASSTYLSPCVARLRELPSESLDFVLSHTVLEHVWLEELPCILRELYRLQRSGSSASHVIDFQDHMDDSLHSLEFDNAFWESRWNRRLNTYTNRVRCSEMLQLFTDTGFQFTIVEQSKWAAPPVPRSALAGSFAGISEDDLLTRVVHLVATKP